VPRARCVRDGQARHSTQVFEELTTGVQRDAEPCVEAESWRGRSAPLPLEGSCQDCRRRGLTVSGPWRQAAILPSALTAASAARLHPDVRLSPLGAANLKRELQGIPSDPHRLRSQSARTPRARTAQPAPGPSTHRIARLRNPQLERVLPRPAQPRFNRWCALAREHGVYSGRPGRNPLCSFLTLRPSCFSNP